MIPVEAYYRLDNLYSDLEKIWRQYGKIREAPELYGIQGILVLSQLNMSGLAALMNLIQEYKNKLR